MSVAATLVINGGSSSLKLGVYRDDNGVEQLLFSGLADGIGRGNGTVVLKDNTGKVIRSANLIPENHRFALQLAAKWLDELIHETPATIGHRVVHGGPNLTHHQLITLQVLDELRRVVPYAPVHAPISLALIEEAEILFPGVPEFVCFDTAFHSTMPEEAKRFAVPRSLYDQGVRRYGAHGLSYESVVYQLGSELPSRTVIAHLGAGASLAAVKDGRSVDTSMGLTPTGGIPMSSRSGDLDPSVLIYLMRSTGINADDLEKLLNQESGLKAVADGSSDMRDLTTASESGNQKAKLAIDIFCRAIAKFIAGYASVLGGLDMLVFVGGIGEHSALVRSEVCHRLRFMGVELNPAANSTDDRTISSPDSMIDVLVLTAQEDIQIARHCRSMVLEASLAV